MKLNKKQKRTATIASMAALLAVVLGMGGQTFAKYITTNTVEAQTAVVAKWGYVIQAVDQNSATDANVDLFKNAYGTSVIAENDVIAPGTNGSLTFNITGVAEVKAEVSFKGLGTWVTPTLTATGVNYRPVVWTLTINGTKTAETTDIDEFKGKVEDVTFAYAANNGSDAGSVIGTPVNDVVVISWNWAFDNSTKANTAVGYNEKANVYDTYLGNKEANIDLPAGYSATTAISYGVEVVITQVQ